MFPFKIVPLTLLLIELNTLYNPIKRVVKTNNLLL